MLKSSFVFLLTYSVIFTPWGANAGGLPSASLIARQLPVDPTAVPPQCEVACNALFTLFGSCSQLDCMCSSYILSAMGDCLICGASLGTSAMTPAYAQQLYDTFSSTCESVGYPVPSLDIQDNLSTVAPTRPPTSSQSTPPPSESTPAFVTPPGSDPSKTATFIAPSVEFVPDSEPTNNAEILIPNVVLLLSAIIGAQLVG